MWSVAIYGFTAPPIAEQMNPPDGGPSYFWMPRQGLRLELLGFRGRPNEGFTVYLGIGRWWRRVQFAWKGD